GRGIFATISRALRDGKKLCDGQAGRAARFHQLPCKGRAAVCGWTSANGQRAPPAPSEWRVQNHSRLREIRKTAGVHQRVGSGWLRGVHTANGSAVRI